MGGGKNGPDAGPSYIPATTTPIEAIAWQAEEINRTVTTPGYQTDTSTFPTGTPAISDPYKNGWPNNPENQLYRFGRVIDDPNTRTGDYSVTGEGTPEGQEPSDTGSVKAPKSVPGTKTAQQLPTPQPQIIYINNPAAQQPVTYATGSDSSGAVAKTGRRKISRGRMSGSPAQSALGSTEGVPGGNVWKQFLGE